MRTIFMILLLLLTTNIWASLYECDGSGYHITIYNPSVVSSDSPAIIIAKGSQVSNVLARDMNINASFEIEVFGLTQTGDYVRYISITVRDPGVPVGNIVEATMSLETQNGHVRGALSCVRGPSKF